jgi:hypothetical protein
MNSYGVIRTVSGVLRQILWEEFSTDPQIKTIVSSAQAVAFTDPKARPGRTA